MVWAHRLAPSKLKAANAWVASLGTTAPCQRATGPRALALVGTLAGQFHLTQRKVQDVLAHIMGIRFSLGTVSQAHGLVSQALAAPVAQLHGLDPHKLFNKTARRELVFFGQHKSSDNTTNCAWRGCTAARHDLVSR